MPRFPDADSARRPSLRARLASGLAALAGIAMACAGAPAHAGQIVSSTPFATFEGNLGYATAARSTSDFDAAANTTCIVDPSTTLTVSGIPAQATVRRAILRWATNTPDTAVSFAGQGITAARSFDDTLTIGEDSISFYGYRADVTNLVSTTGNGSYTFADLASRTSVPIGKTCLGGAMLLVVYDTTLDDPDRHNRIDLFEGFEGIRGAGGATGGTISTVSIPIDLTNTDRVAVSTMSWQGAIDSNDNFGDEFEVNGTLISNASNPVDDANNGSGAGAAPDSEYGVDFDTFDVSSIAAGSTNITVINRSTDFDYLIVQGFVIGASGSENSDAPVATYGLATHAQSTAYFMGSAIDHEVLPNAFAGSAAADFDDANQLDDDDGVSIPLLRAGRGGTIQVSVTQQTAGGGYLQGWIDWNADGDFADAGERVATDLRLTGATTGTIPVPVAVPNGAPAGTTIARFRWSTAQGLDSTALAPNGEVEDGTLTILAAALPPVTPQPIGICAVESVLYQQLFDTGATGGFGSTQSANPPVGMGAARNNIDDADGTVTDPTVTAALNGGGGVPSPSGGGFVGAFDNASGTPFWTTPTLGIDASGAVGGAISYELWNWRAGGTAGAYAEAAQDFVIVGAGGRLVLDYATATIGGALVVGDWVTIERRLQPGAEWFHVPGTDLNSQNGRAPATAADFASVLGSVQYMGVAPEAITGGDFPATGDGKATERYAVDTLRLLSCATDHSDAPLTGTSYGAASHTIVPGIRLGGAVTAEAAPYDSADADGDADDGVGVPATLQPGSTARFTVSVSGAAGLSAWIDFDGSGSFDGPVEQVANDLEDTDGNGEILLDVAIPEWAVRGRTFARFRLSSDPRVGPGGPAFDGEVEDYAVTIADATAGLSGRLFLDNGAGGATAHDGLIGGAEAAAAYGTIALFDTGGGPLATASVGADGRWSAALPSGYAGEVVLVATPVAGLSAISENTGTLTGVTNPDATDGTFRFAVAAGAGYSGIDIGFIAPPQLAADRTSAIEPGSVVALSHVYSATTSGTVTFALTDIVANPQDGFASALFRDADCDGVADQAIGPVTVAAGQRVCVVVRTQASAGISPAASLTYGLTATTAFAGTARSDVARNDDALGGGGGSDVVLRKLVRNISDPGGVEAVSNSGDIGDVLRYRIVVSNPSAGPATNITVFDAVPAYTALNAAVPGTTTITTGVTCTLQRPTGASNAPGYAGPIEWSCPGSFPPGAEGSLSFDVAISP